MKESELIKKAKEGYSNEYQSIPENREFLNELKKLNKNQMKRKGFVWLTQPIPAYSLALACLLFALVFVFSKPQPTELVVYREAKTITIIDTIVQMDTVSIIKEVEKIIIKKEKQLVQKDSNPLKIGSSSPTMPTSANSGEFVFNASQVDEQQNLLGRSTENNQLGMFLGVKI